MVKETRLFTPVLVAGSIIVLVGFAIRASFGVFQIPIQDEFGWLRSEFSLAIAIQNLAWGFGAPIFGAFSEKLGDRRAIVLGALLYSLGLLLTATLMLLVTSGKIVVAFAVGQWILKQKGKRVNSVMQTFSLFVGLLFVYLATMLPFVGGFIWFVVSFLGVGTILLMMINSQRELEPSETPPPAEDPFSVA